MNATLLTASLQVLKSKYGTRPMQPSFEYFTEFLPISYKAVTRGLLFKSQEPTTEPDIQNFLLDAERQALLNRHGRAGWELVSVQMVMRGHSQVGNQNAQGWAFGYGLPTGYLLFFKRQLMIENA